MKVGARRLEQNEIARMAKEGSTAQEISQALLINVKTVKSFMPKDEEVDESGEVELTEDQKTEITEITEMADDNTAEEIAEALDLDLEVVQAFLEE